MATMNSLWIDRSASASSWSRALSSSVKATLRTNSLSSLVDEQGFGRGSLTELSF